MIITQITEIQGIIFLFYCLVIFVLGIFSDNSLVFQLCISFIGLCFMIMTSLTNQSEFGLLIYVLFTCMCFIDIFFYGGKHGIDG